ncbi:hypothetical protein BC835DRAFT_1310058 [Cytidiella melzeri]|nr:hypothetical protein BC835DRAFT_1310058 [Cytidiella melzeri]
MSHPTIELSSPIGGLAVQEMQKGIERYFETEGVRGVGDPSEIPIATTTLKEVAHSSQHIQWLVFVLSFDVQHINKLKPPFKTPSTLHEQDSQSSTGVTYVFNPEALQKLSPRMSQSESFMIKRRRRRCHRKVDLSSPASADHSTSDRDSKSQLTTRSKTERQRTSERPITVEGFLRQSISTPKGVTKRRIVDLNSATRPGTPKKEYDTTKHKGTSSSPPDREQHAAVGSTDGISSSSPLPRPKVGTLSNRMLRAAALSHVQLDPSASLAHIVDADRPTLKFEAIASSTLESRSQLKTKKWRLVDPRRVQDLRSADFSSGSSYVPAPLTSRRPLQALRRRTDELVDLPARCSLVTKRKRQSSKAILRESPGPKPLSLVPVELPSETLRAST